MCIEILKHVYKAVENTNNIQWNASNSRD